MKKLILLYFMFLISISLICGFCEEGQININSANLEDLDNLDGIGPVKAQAIIDTRPFESINNLIYVYGIGEITLDKIIEQGLACVKGEPENEEETEEEEEPEEVVEEEIIKEVTQEIIEEYLEDPVNGLSGEATLTPEVISLTPKDIKSEDNIESLDKTDYAKYGFIAFCILIGVLLILKNKRKTKK